jgi:hypothetical protein
MLYEVPDDPKMLRETLCVAQSRIVNSGYDVSRKTEHVNRLQRLIDECERHRPLGPDGKHGNLHTLTCGCSDDEKPSELRRSNNCPLDGQSKEWHLFVAGRDSQGRPRTNGEFIGCDFGKEE